ncbi:MAG: ribbon-helix-helix protein, CopG family [Candidatus Jordarchaeales archaeon]
MPKIFHRITVALDDFDIKLVDYLREKTGKSVSQVFREALQLYHNLVKATEKAGIGDYRKYFSDIGRLALHIHGVEERQFAVIDRELYRVLVKKLQEKVDPSELEKDEEFLMAIQSTARLFEYAYRWRDDESPVKKAQDVLWMMDFAGAGTLTKVGAADFVFQTPPEILVITKLIVKCIFDALGINADMDSTTEKIFIRVKER